MGTESKDDATDSVLDALNEALREINRHIERKPFHDTHSAREDRRKIIDRIIAISMEISSQPNLPASHE